MQSDYVTGKLFSLGCCQTDDNDFTAKLLSQRDREDVGLAGIEVKPQEVNKREGGGRAAKAAASRAELDQTVEGCHREGAAAMQVCSLLAVTTSSSFHVGLRADWILQCLIITSCGIARQDGPELAGWHANFSKYLCNTTHR